VSQHKRLRVILGAVVAASFSALGHFGHKAVGNAPPIPREVVTQDGRRAPPRGREPVGVAPPDFVLPRG
jgi:hypothetical protein